MSKKLTVSEIPQLRDAIKIQQGYKCGLCECDFREAKLFKGKLVPKFTATLDHDHKTGKIRGVLCSNCNGLEGKIQNRVNRAKRDLTDIEWLNKLVKYWGNPPSTIIHPLHKTADEKRLLINKRARNKRAAAKAARIIG